MIKETLKELYETERNAYDVWVYLWLNSNSKGEVVFSKKKISLELGVSLSTTYRALDKHAYRFCSGIESHDKKNYHVLKFSGAKSTSTKKVDELQGLYDRLYEYLKEYYSRAEFEYTALPNHKKLIKTIVGKLKKAMNKTDKVVVTEQTLEDTFKMFFEGVLNTWFGQEKQLSLNTINRNFDKILNDIKRMHNGKKSDSYARAKQEAESIDFSKLQNN